MTRDASEALILVPGLLCDALVWQHAIATFAPTRRVVVPMLDTLDSIPAMATQLLADAPARFALAGHSLGGRIALEVYRQAPQRVSRLALLDTGVHPCAPGEPARRQELVSLALTRGMRALARAWLPPMVHPARRADPAIIGPLEAMVERRTPDTFRNQVTALLNRPDAAPVLAAISCPSLVLCGREDEWSPLAQHEVIASGIRCARLAVIDDAGHFAPFEQPAAVTDQLRTWLE